MDADQTFTFNQKSEVIAFNDSLVIPRMEERIRMDTAWVDSLTYDTIVERKYMHYLPDDLILRAFKEFNYSQYLNGLFRRNLRSILPVRQILYLH